MIKLSYTATDVKVTFAVSHDQPIDGCSVVGDFKGWQPGKHSMRRRSNGARSRGYSFMWHSPPVSLPRRQWALVQRLRCRGA
jgi:hypothetical protein